MLFKTIPMSSNAGLLPNAPALNPSTRAALTTTENTIQHQCEGFTTPRQMQEFWANLSEYATRNLAAIALGGGGSTQGAGTGG